jgi:hypothetical protein
MQGHAAISIGYSILLLLKFSAIGSIKPSSPGSILRSAP